MRYAETLKTGDRAYVWQGDVCFPVTVQKKSGRHILVNRFGRFGAKTGKGIDQRGAKLATLAGENEVDV